MPKDTFLNLPREKRDAILEAATDEFARQPYARASLSRIVARVGIAKGSVYQYFENKLDLYRYVIECGSNAKLEFVGDKLFPEPGHFFDWLDDAMLSGLRFAAAHPRLAHISIALFVDREPELSEFAQGVRKVGLDHMADLIREAQLHREVRDDVDPMTLAIAIGAIQRPGIFELLQARFGAARPEDIFDDHRLDTISDAELKHLVHQLTSLLRRGAATEDGPRPVRDIPRVTRPDFKRKLDRAFAGEGGDDVVPSANAPKETKETQ